MPLLAPARTAVLGFESGCELKWQEARQVWLCAQVNRSAAPSIAAIRSPARDKLLTAERGGAVAAVSCFDPNFGSIDEHRNLQPQHATQAQIQSLADAGLR